MSNRLEYLISKLSNNEKVTNWNSLNRLEEYLICCINKEGIENLGEPQNRLEVLLEELYYQPNIEIEGHQVASIIKDFSAAEYLGTTQVITDDLDETVYDKVTVVLPEGTNLAVEVSSLPEIGEQDKLYILKQSGYKIYMNFNQPTDISALGVTYEVFEVDSLPTSNIKATIDESNMYFYYIPSEKNLYIYRYDNVDITGWMSNEEIFGDSYVGEISSPDMLEVGSTGIVNLGNTPLYYQYTTEWVKYVLSGSEVLPTEEKTVTPRIADQEVYPSSGHTLSKVTVKAMKYKTVNITPTIDSYTHSWSWDGTVITELYVGPVTSEVDSNIQPENIKEGVTILGVEGTCVASNTLKELLDYTKHTRYMFSNYYGMGVINSIKYDDTENVEDMSHMYENSPNYFIPPLLNTAKVKNMSYIFNGCSQVAEIPEYDASNVEDFTDAFKDCSALTAILMTGMKVSFDISASSNFTASNLIVIFNNLATVATEQTLTIGEINLAKLTDDEKALATDKGWILA